jgi:hypothetical protein
MDFARSRQSYVADVRVGDGEMRGYWTRAWGGRLVHFFIGGKRTACGKLLSPHDPKDAWYTIGYSKCKRCVAVLEARNGENDARNDTP